MLSILSAFSLCACRVACKYGSISRFKGVFRGFYVFGVGLCCLRALRGLWGFCVREWLGGFGACCVFALVFPLFAIVFLLLSCFCPLLCLVSLCLLSFLAPIVFCLFSCLCCFFFPFGLYAKERAQRFCPLCPLFVCCGLLYLVAALYSSNSSGLSPLTS